jgi:hypothetical protein
MLWRALSTRARVRAWAVTHGSPFNSYPIGDLWVTDWVAIKVIPVLIARPKGFEIVSKPVIGGLKNVVNVQSGTRPACRFDGQAGDVAC